ncbi:MAG: hypothetical protein SFY69_01625 [Planctomycetota bacterium]|nr:hypothetical protein [Planctomycetota bacterium]
MRPTVRRWLLRLVIAVPVIIGCVALALFLAVRAAPAWWEQANPGAYAGELGTQFENACVSQITAVRPAAAASAPDAPYRSEVWRVSLSERDLSAWASERLRPWLESNDPAFRWPDGLGGVRVDVRDGFIRIGAPVGDDAAIVTLDCEVFVDDAGGLRVRVVGARAGALPVPVGLALARAGAMPADVADMLRGERPLLPEAVIPADGARSVRLLGVRAREGALEIEARTESNPAR